MTSTSVVDDLEAVRRIAELLEKFQHDERSRIIRWALEKVGSPPGAATAIPGLAVPGQAIPGVMTTAMVRTPGDDIRSFVQTKSPGNDVAFAAVVAYYHAFEAPADVRKAEIGSEDLQEAARLSQRERLVRPITTLHNAVKRGYLDSGSSRGTFKINTVGENLVAMSLPAGEAQATTRRRSVRKKGAPRPARKK